MTASERTANAAERTARAAGRTANAAAEWQRLDHWLWCARFMKQRSDCARLAGEGRLRLNRQVTDKAHARLRVGDVLTFSLRGEVRVIEVLALAERRGPAGEARRLYREIGTALTLVGGADVGGEGACGAESCGGPKEAAYRSL